jgi:dTMP kinase
MLILIEGTDSSGKSTQSALLMKELQAMGKDVEKVKFPAYDTPFGEMVARYLRGEFGKLNEVPPEVASLLYTIDRYQFKDALFKKLGEGKILVTDRYLQSNIAYQGAKFSGEEKRS